MNNVRIKHIRMCMCVILFPVFPLSELNDSEFAFVVAPVSL